MDFITGLLRIKRVDTILVVVNRLTKYMHFIAICHFYTTNEIAEVFVTEVVCLHGFPKTS